MTDTNQRALLRSLPQVEESLSSPALERAVQRLSRRFVADCAREAVAQARADVLAGRADQVDVDAIAADAARRALALADPSLRRAVNATGVVVHTNLGRSPLALAAVEAVQDVARSYSTLEYDAAARTRGSRHDHVERLACTLTGAEAALAVNNNAAAVLLVLSEFAAGHEAVVSRGELVEIGGSFRVPDIMALSQAAMVEVGTTNKTHPSDYARALTDRTSLLLKVHPSNFRLVGFTESVGVGELRALADEENARRACELAGDAAEPAEVLVYEDQGSGSLVSLPCFDGDEPSVSESLAAGCDLVSFSGDKLLGGPQAGIVVGAKRHVDRLKKNPLARALRLDKMTLAALEATLRLYLDEERALRDVPTLRMLSEPADVVRGRAEALAEAIVDAAPSGCLQVEVVPEVARAGGGALPLCDIPSYAVAVSFARGSVAACEAHLASGRSVPVVGRIKKDRLLFDARTLLGQEDADEIVRGLAEYAELAAREA